MSSVFEDLDAWLERFRIHIDYQDFKIFYQDWYPEHMLNMDVYRSASHIILEAVEQASTRGLDVAKVYIALSFLLYSTDWLVSVQAGNHQIYFFVLEGVPYYLDYRFVCLNVLDLTHNIQRAEIDQLLHFQTSNHIGAVYTNGEWYVEPCINASFLNSSHYFSNQAELSFGGLFYFYKLNNRPAVYDCNSGTMYWVPEDALDKLPPSVFDSYQSYGHTSMSSSE